MGNKKNKNSNTTSVLSVSYRNGKWVTSDGLCFTTALKACRHAEESGHSGELPEESSGESKEEEEKYKDGSMPACVNRDIDIVQIT